MNKHQQKMLTFYSNHLEIKVHINILGQKRLVILIVKC